MLPVAGAAPSGGQGSSGWLQIHTENFTLLSSVSERLSVDLGRKLEVLRLVLAKVYPSLQLRSSVPTWVIVFRDKGEFQRHLPRGKDSAGLVGGYFVSGAARNYAVVLAGSPDDALQGVYHEYVHFIIRNNLADVPLWFEEGLAECFDSFRFDGKRAEFARVQEDKLGFMRARSFMPLGEFLAATTASGAYRSGESSVLFHVQAWAMVHYLLWDRPERRQQLIRYLEALREGARIDDAFELSFATTYAKFEGELRAHIEQRRFVIGSVAISDMPAPERGAVKPLGRADLLVHLGNLLARVAPHRDDEAVEDYEEALRTDPAAAGAHAGLGEILDRRGLHDEADRRFESALSMAPKDPWINLAYALILLRRQELEGPRGIAAGADPPAGLVRARALFQKTIEARSDCGEAYLGFAKTFLYGGGPWGVAIPSLEIARGLLPNRTDVVACLAVAQLRKGDLAPGRESLARLARMGSVEAVGFVAAALAPSVAAGEEAASGLPGGAAPTFELAISGIEDERLRQRLADLLRRAREGNAAGSDR